MTTRIRISRLNHDILRNTVHFDSSALFEKLKGGGIAQSIQSEIDDLHKGWNEFQSSISPLLSKFIDDCGPSASLRYLFAGFDEDDADWFLADAQSHWIERHQVEDQLDRIKVLMNQISIAIEGIGDCFERSVGCEHVVQLDTLLSSLSNAISKLPPEESV